MDNNTLHDKFRLQLTNVHALTVLTVSLFEIIGYIILVLADVEFFSIKNHYLWYGVIFPIVVNIGTHAVARLIIHNPDVSRERKNTSIIVAALITSFIVAIIHKEYIATSCAFIFPIILSAMFNSKKLLNTSFIVSVFILLSVGVAFILDRSATLNTSISLFILFGFLLISYLCGIISINFSRQNYMTIESQSVENDRLMNDVLRDQMTGLYNHQSFVDQLEEYVNAFHPDHPLCLAIIDIDDFKHVNDRYGHSCGDVVLTQLAKFIKKYASQDMIAYRYGGEEFAVLFLDKNMHEAFTVLQKILNEFRKHKFMFSNKPITFSAGISEYNDTITSSELFEMTDKTLYQAKREGKNRILTSK